VLIALGINDKGKREVLGVQVSLSEAEVYWREFLLIFKLTEIRLFKHVL
jgi:transposase-like protein